VILGARTVLVKEPDLLRQMEMIVKSVQEVKSIELQMSNLKEWND